MTWDWEREHQMSKRLVEHEKSSVLSMGALKPGDHDIPGIHLGRHDGVNIRKAKNGWLITVYRTDEKNGRQEDTIWVADEDKLNEVLAVALVADKLT